MEETTPPKEPLEQPATAAARGDETTPDQKVAILETIVDETHQRYVALVDETHQRYAALEKRYRQLQEILFVVCLFLGPFAGAFFFSPRTVPHFPHGYCDTLRTAAHELEYSPDKDKDPTGAKAALDALTPLIEQCPDPKDDE
jgi:hypothetical protein